MNRKLITYLSAVLLIGIALFQFLSPSPKGEANNTVNAPGQSSQNKSGQSNNSTPVQIATHSKKTDHEQWNQYLKGTVTYDDLSSANQKRVDRKKELFDLGEKEERLKKIREKDYSKNRNIATWEKEDDLKQRSASLRLGLTQASVLEVMGTPTQVGQTMERIIQNNLNQGLDTTYPIEFKVPNTRITYNRTLWQSIETIEKLPVTGPKGAETVFVYSPHPTGKTIYSTGDAFQYLEIWFNNQDGTVIGWQWTKPNVVF